MTFVFSFFLFFCFSKKNFGSDDESRGNFCKCNKRCSRLCVVKSWRGKSGKFWKKMKKKIGAKGSGSFRDWTSKWEELVSSLHSWPRVMEGWLLSLWFFKSSLSLCAVSLCFTSFFLSVLFLFRFLCVRNFFLEIPFVWYHGIFYIVLFLANLNFDLCKE